MTGAKDQSGPIGPPPPEAAKAETRLTGHIGHFTAAEESAFEQFKKLIAKDGYYTPPTATAGASHDDGTLMYDRPVRIVVLLATPLTLRKPILESAKIHSSRSLHSVQGDGDLAEGV